MAGPREDSSMDRAAFEDNAKNAGYRIDTSERHGDNGSEVAVARRTPR